MGARRFDPPPGAPAAVQTMLRALLGPGRIGRRSRVSARFQKLGEFHGLPRLDGVKNVRCELFKGLRCAPIFFFRRERPDARQVRPRCHGVSEDGPDARVETGLLKSSFFPRRPCPCPPVNRALATTQRNCVTVFSSYVTLKPVVADYASDQARLVMPYDMQPSVCNELSRARW